MGRWELPVCIVCLLAVVAGGLGLIWWKSHQTHILPPLPQPKVLDSETAQAQARWRFAQQQQAERDAERQRQAEIEEAALEVVRSRGPQVGMLGSDVLRIWGEPGYEQVLTTSQGVTRLWYYGASRKLQVMVTNGRVEAVNVW